MSSTFSRRSMMRGMVGGAAVCVGIPTLDMFLDGNGKAYADTARGCRSGSAPTSGASA